jgi:hypothetical protein
MRKALMTLVALSSLSLMAVGCVGAEPQEHEESPAGEAEQAVTYPLCRWWGSLPVQLTQDPMNHLYYDINPTPHSEKAYQPSDPSPPIATSPTYSDASGSITVLDTALYNRSCSPGPCYGTVVSYRVHSPRGTVICEDSAPIPFRHDNPNLIGNHPYYIQPMTVNTQTKILPTNLAF